MTNIILKTWNEANKETRVDFITIFCKFYHDLICPVIKDLNKCHPVKEDAHDFRTSTGSV